MAHAITLTREEMVWASYEKTPAEKQATYLMSLEALVNNDEDYLDYL